MEDTSCMICHSASATHGPPLPSPHRIACLMCSLGYGYVDKAGERPLDPEDAAQKVFLNRTKNCDCTMTVAQFREMITRDACETCKRPRHDGTYLAVARIYLHKGFVDGNCVAQCNVCHVTRKGLDIPTWQTYMMDIADAQAHDPTAWPEMIGNAYSSERCAYTCLPPMPIHDKDSVDGRIQHPIITKMKVALGHDAFMDHVYAVADVARSSHGVRQSIDPPVDSMTQDVKRLSALYNESPELVKKPQRHINRSLFGGSRSQKYISDLDYWLRQVIKYNRAWLGGGARVCRSHGGLRKRKIKRLTYVIKNNKVVLS